jgi:hypothetical protein
VEANNFLAFLVDVLWAMTGLLMLPKALKFSQLLGYSLIGDGFSLFEFFFAPSGWPVYYWQRPGTAYVSHASLFWLISHLALAGILFTDASTLLAKHLRQPSLHPLSPRRATREQYFTFWAFIVLVLSNLPRLPAVYPVAFVIAIWFATCALMLSFDDFWLFRRIAPIAPLFVNSMIGQQTEKKELIIFMVVCYLAVFLEAASLFIS